MQDDLFRKRLWVGITGITIMVVLFAVRLFYLQILKSDYYSEEADKQYTTSASQLFDRGTIFFSDKNEDVISAASVKSGFKVALNTKIAKDPQKLYELLGAFVDLDQSTFIKIASKKDAQYVELVTKLDEDRAKKISEQKIPGVTVSRNNWRFYPAETLASQTIGFMGYRGDDFVGRYGIERYYDKVLSRTDKRLYVNFFAEIFSDIHTLINNSEELEGDVVTHLEPLVQQNLEDLLNASQEKWASDRVGGIVMDPQTGRILAMGFDRGFNSNETRTVTDVSVFNNPLVESNFEMGSIMKPVIMAIALDEKAVTPTTTYFDQGFVKVADRTIYNFDKKGRGLVDMKTVLEQSLNTGMVFTMQKMKKEDFKKHWLSFGFGQKTGIDLPGEGSGLISNINTNRDVEYANISFGQGVAITPVMMTRALAVLANGGKLVTPHVAKKIEYPSGFSRTLSWPTVEGVITPETSQQITDMMVGVFDSYNGGKTKLEHYAIAAKTGTAQIANPSGGYYTDRNLHTFVGYFPAKNPQFIIFLYNQYPKNGARFSSETLIPPFTDLAKFLINYYDIPPDR